MTRVAVITDSTADLDPAAVAEAGITIVPAAIRLGAGAVQAPDGALPVADQGPGSAVGVRFRNFPELN